MQAAETCGSPLKPAEGSTRPRRRIDPLARPVPAVQDRSPHELNLLLSTHAFLRLIAGSVESLRIGSENLACHQDKSSAGPAILPMNPSGVA